MSWLGLDIGGANIKVADGVGYAQSIAFPLWRQPEQLATELQKLIMDAPSAEAIAVTMTGELADCFETKAAGVTAILTAVEQAAGREVRVYLCDSRLVDLQTARNETLLAAASNWHVLAAFAGRFCSGKEGLLVDIGSTTCDLIPLGPSGPRTLGITDPERLAACELIYTGVVRSPICAIVSQLPWRDTMCPVAQELFANAQDAYLLLNELPEEPENLSTADGQPATKPFAHARLARSICADTTMFSRADAERAAQAIATAQLELLGSSLTKVLERQTSSPATFVLSGQGEFLGRKLLAKLNLPDSVVSLAEELGPAVSRAACAHALAVMACERAEA